MGDRRRFRPRLKIGSQNPHPNVAKNATLRIRNMGADGTFPDFLSCGSIKSREGDGCGIPPLRKRPRKDGAPGCGYTFVEMRSTLPSGPGARNRSESMN